MQWQWQKYSVYAVAGIMETLVENMKAGQPLLNGHTVSGLDGPPPAGRLIKMRALFVTDEDERIRTLLGSDKRYSTPPNLRR